VIALIQNGIYILQLDEENRSIIIGTAILVAAAMDSWISQRFRKSRHTT